MKHFNLLIFTIFCLTFSVKASCKTTAKQVDDKIYVLDTIIAKDDGSVILKYRTFHGDVAKGVSYRDVDDHVFKKHVKTIYNHPTLNNNNSADAIKSATPPGVGLVIAGENGESALQFQNPLSEVVFIGFKTSE
jgi:hypothetical protein